MNSLELAFGSGVVAILLALGGFFTWRQLATLRQLRRRTDLSAEDQIFFRGQALRRLAASVLMLVLAGMLLGWYFFVLRDFQTMMANMEQRPDKDAPLDPEQREFARMFTVYLVVALCVLSLFALVAVLDMTATLKYGIRKHRQLRDQHRTALEEEVRRLRQQRNGDK